MKQDVMKGRTTQLNEITVDIKYGLKGTKDVDTVKARVYYSYSVIHNPTLLPQRPLEPSQFSVGISDTQRNSPPDRFYMLTTNHVNSVENKLPKLFKSYLVFYWSLMCKVNNVQST